MPTKKIFYTTMLLLTTMSTAFAIKVPTLLSPFATKKQVLETAKKLSDGIQLLGREFAPNTSLIVTTKDSDFDFFEPFEMVPVVTYGISQIRTDIKSLAKLLPIELLLDLDNRDLITKHLSKIHTFFENEKALRVYSKISQSYTRIKAFADPKFDDYHSMNLATKDIRDHIALRRIWQSHNITEEQLFSSLEIFNSEQKKFILDRMISICKKQKKRDQWASDDFWLDLKIAITNCSLEVRNAQKHGELYKLYLKYFRGFYKKGIVWSDFLTDIKPKKMLKKSYATVSYEETDKPVIIIFFSSSGDKEVDNYISKSVEDFYTHHRLQVSIEFVEENENYRPIKVLLKNEGPSLFNHSEKQLELATESIYNRSSGLAKTITHEVGHILGFSDCYFDGFNTKTLNGETYPYDPSNYMCSLKGGLLDEHINALFITYGL